MVEIGFCRTNPEIKALPCFIDGKIQYLVQFTD